MPDKVYKTLNSQMRILRSRGLLISGSRDKDILKRENYYNLINGYKMPFINKQNTSTNEQYLSGTKLSEIYALYCFDRELRSIFIRYILEIENNVKSIIARCFSETYGHKNYLRVENFETLSPVPPSNHTYKTDVKKVAEVTQLISGIQHDIGHQLSKKNPMITHYITNYGYVPLWVLVNSLTLGTISKFYAHLKQSDKNAVAKNLNTKKEYLERFLDLLTVYRNICAHDERLFNFKTFKNKKPHSIHTFVEHQLLNIPMSNTNMPILGKNDLFAVVIIFKKLLPPQRFKNFFKALEKEINTLSKGLQTIGISDIEHEMGFPTNWRDIIKI